MKNTFFATAFLICGAVNVNAQQPIRYEVSFPDHVHHEAKIRMFIPQVKEYANIRMSRSSPGRYATHEFGKNIYDVKAYDSASKKEVDVLKLAGDVYSINFTTTSLMVEYTLFGDHVDGTYSAIDRNHAHLNIPATFMWVVGRDKSPVEVNFIVPEKSNWKVATQLFPGKTPMQFFAPDLQYFMDSPVELSDFKERNWTVQHKNGKSQVISLVLHGDVADDVLDAFASDVKKIVSESAKVFGELPDFDYGKYTFLMDLMPSNHGDGMEHRNSTVITRPADKLTLDVLKARFGTTAHEFFHAWNVERIRPETLEPFDFTTANMSDGLWVAEGFTQYYGGLILVRAGLQSDSAFLRTLGFYVGGLTNLPGGKFYTPVQASEMAIFTDAATAIDKTNFGNIFYSYYSYGAGIAGILDLTLRKDHNQTLDAYMQLLWRKFGKTGKPYTIGALEAALGELTSIAFAKQFFKSYVHGTDRPSLQSVFSSVGVLMDAPGAGRASIGNYQVKIAEGRGELTSVVQKGTPLYEAGLETGDLIISLDGKPITTSESFAEVISSKQPGDEIPVRFISRGVTIDARLKTTELPGLSLRLDYSATSGQNLKRTAWLKGGI
ncbi:PDZ domain-containing protein [Terrimonas sp. NA20]|uniref:PDZ domain-containing protein n=1 Tax=Terrimonas ginsenosidimutans TaxID=2908004 RepID=A0ABS9KYK5_9BACT|nr:PDZ domain-containing protein [Terrimonas ginsenosidimutans]MCG2617368.1 PDZ domain-containing protein [Terrimonas ginsenosidimutans]